MRTQSTRNLRRFVLGGALALLGAGAVHAAPAKLHTMAIDAPDGSVVEVQYSGDVAPQVRFVPQTHPRSVSYDPFAEMDRISAFMDAHMQAMMQQAAAMQQRVHQTLASGATPAGSGFATPGLTLVGNVPAGVHVTYVSSTTDANGCTRTVSYSSDGSEAQPRLTQASSQGCDAAGPNPATIPVKAEAHSRMAQEALGEKV